MDQGHDRPLEPTEPNGEGTPETDAPAETPGMSAASPPSRWDQPAKPGLARRVLGGLSSRDGAGLAALRVLALVGLVGGALYAALVVLPSDREDTAAVVRAPTVIPSRSVLVDSVPVRPAPAPVLMYEASNALRDLDLRGSKSAFVRLVPEDPAAVCEELAKAGWSTKGWGRSPLGGTGECLADRRYGPDGKASGFAVLRGQETLSELRIKLNVGDPAMRAQAGRDIAGLVAGLFERWRWEGAQALGERIAALEPFDTAMLGTKVRLMRERGDVERWNLVMRFPTPPRPPETDQNGKPTGTLAAIAAMADAELPGTTSGADHPESAAE